MQNDNLKFKIVLIAIPLLFFCFLNFANAYDDKTTHPALTDEIVDFYNLSFPDKPLTPQQKEWIIEGSILEDTPSRWINHFYDPINKTGWSGEYAGKYDAKTVQLISKNLIAPFGITPVSSLDWLHNKQLQAQYGFYQGDKTWERGILEMIKGNEEESYKILGHVLHLIEDASVPEHTRNDTHAHELEGMTGDYGSPYEEYLKKYTRETIKKDLNLAVDLKHEGLVPVQKNSIDDYLISLAQYSNRYFFSKDTINDPKYQNPKIIRDDGMFGYGADENGKEFPLVKSTMVNTNDEIKNFYSILNKEEYYPIIDAYFSRLSRQAVLNGAGVIKLFLDEVQIEKEYPQHVVVYDSSVFNYFEIPRISLTGEAVRLWKAAQSFSAQVGSTVGNIFSSVANFFSQDNNQNFQPAGQISLNQSESQSQTNQKPLNQESQKPQLAKKSSRKTSDKEVSNLKNEIALLKKEINSLKKQPNNLDDPSSQKKIQNNNEEGQKEKNIKSNDVKSELSVAPSSTTAVPAAPSINCSFTASQSPSRQGVVINEVAWMGTTNSAEDEWIELKNISANEINLSNWQLIDKGEQIKINFSSLKRITIKPGQFILLERTNDDSVPGMAADLIYTGALSNSDESLRLFDNQCNLIDEVLADPAWPAGDNLNKRTAERNNNDFNWHTSSIIGGTPKQENSQLIIYGGGGVFVSANGNESGNNNQQQTPNSSQQTAIKILINEIQLASASSTNDEFVELYNPNNSEVALTGWYLQKKTKTGASFSTFAKADLFSGKIIGAKGYLLISHPSSTFSYDISSDYGLADNNTLVLKNPNGEIMDKAGWGDVSDFEGSGAAPNPQKNFSIQRKFQNNNFIDTDDNAQDFEIQTCPSPKDQLKNCPAANQAPNAFFIFSPLNPKVGEEIIFDAASSTDSDGNVVSYQWDFGDDFNSTATDATTTHSYVLVGSYPVRLVVFDDQNASSSVASVVNISSSTTISVTTSTASSAANHIVISEILFNASGTDAGKEFIELYNPNASSDLAKWSIKYQKEDSTLSVSLASFKTALHSEDQTIIPDKGFLLIGFNNYDAKNYNGRSADILRETALPNGDFQDVSQKAIIILSDDQGKEIDKIFYDKNSITAEGQSLERKTFLDNVCVSSQNEGEFLGNGCDRDYDTGNSSTTDFEIRQLPRPQNSQNLAEPRKAPAVLNFTGIFSTSTLNLIFNWDFSLDARGATSTVVYKLRDETATSTQIFYGSGVNQFIKTIDFSSTGQDYIFSLQAYDAEGLAGASSNITIPVPLVSMATSTAASTTPEPQILLEDATTTWRTSIPPGAFSEDPFWGHRVLGPATTTYTTKTAKSFSVTEVRITNNLDYSYNNHDYLGNLRVALIDPASGSVTASSTNSCYGEGGCGGFPFTFKNSLLTPATFWLQFYVDDGLQGAADWSVNGITLYGLSQ